MARRTSQPSSPAPVDPDPHEEAHLFPTYGGNRPFVAGGRARGSHWLDGPPDGDRWYVCDWGLDGVVPDLFIAPRLSTAAFAPPDDARDLPRVRASADDVDRAVVARSRATDALARLVADLDPRDALLARGARLHVRSVGEGRCRATFELAAGADVLSTGAEPEHAYAVDRDAAQQMLRRGAGRVERVASVTAAGVARGIAHARALVVALDALAREGNWRFASKYQPGPLDDAGLARLLEAVLASTSWLSGHADRVADGVEARLTLPIGDAEHAATLLVRPLDAGAVAATLTAALPDADGDALVLSPERGLRAKLRALRELEIGDATLDDALLVEGDARRVDEVRAAAAAFVELLGVDARGRAAHAVTATIDRERLVVAIPRAAFDARLPEILGAALEAWHLVARRRRGLS